MWLWYRLTATEDREKGGRRPDAAWDMGLPYLNSLSLLFSCTHIIIISANFSLADCAVRESCSAVLSQPPVEFTGR